MNYMQKILQAAAEENMEQMTQIVQEAAEIESDENLYSLAEQLLDAGFVDQAEYLYKKLLEIYPEADELKLTLSEIAIENGNIEVAFEYVDSIAEESDNYPAALFVLADLYQILGMPDISEQKLLAAKDLVEDQALLNFALAELYYANGHFREALRLYQQLIAGEEDVPPGISLYERAGSSLAMLGELEEAVPYLEEAAKDEHPTQLYELGFVYNQLAETGRSIKIFKRLIEVDPDYPGAFLELGSALVEEKQVEEALRTFVEGIRRNPFDPELYLRAAEASWNLGDNEQAEKWLLEATAIAEDEDEILQELSHFYLQQGEYTKVIELLDPLEEPSPAILWVLAEAFYKEEEFAKAGVAFSRAYDHLQNEPDFLKTYALYLREEGQQERSIELLKAYSEMEPNDLEVQNLLHENDD